MARHHAREMALKILFEHDLVHNAMDDLLLRMLATEDAEDAAFTTQVVRGTLEHMADLDKAIESSAIDWKVSRMATIDRNILRMAAYEMEYQKDIPLSVIINEAVELAQSYSTTEAKRFINGVLATLARTFRAEGDLDRL